MKTTSSLRFIVEEKMDPLEESGHSCFSPEISRAWQKCEVAVSVAVEIHFQLVWGDQWTFEARTYGIRDVIKVSLQSHLSQALPLSVILWNWNALRVQTNVFSCYKYSRVISSDCIKHIGSIWLKTIVQTNLFAGFLDQIQLAVLEPWRYGFAQWYHY